MITRPGVNCAEVCNSPGNIPSFQGVSGGKGEDGTVQYLVVLGQNVAVLDGTESAFGQYWLGHGDNGSLLGGTWWFWVSIVL